LLEGKTVNLRVVEKEDLNLLLDWFNNPEIAGRYKPLDPQQSRQEFENRYDKLGPDEKFFFIEKKDGSKTVSVYSVYNLGNVLKLSIKNRSHRMVNGADEKKTCVYCSSNHYIRHHYYTHLRAL
jgi:hypothetical protein